MPAAPVGHFLRLHSLDGRVGGGLLVCDVVTQKDAAKWKNVGPNCQCCGHDIEDVVGGGLVDVPAAAADRISSVREHDGRLAGGGVEVPEAVCGQVRVV